MRLTAQFTAHRVSSFSDNVVLVTGNGASQSSVSAFNFTWPPSIPSLKMQNAKCEMNRSYHKATTKDGDNRYLRLRSRFAPCHCSSNAQIIGVDHRLFTRLATDSDPCCNCSTAPRPSSFSSSSSISASVAFPSELHQFYSEWANEPGRHVV